MRYILAASTLPAGKAAAKAVLKPVADHREEFEDHCHGDNMQTTPAQIIGRLQRYSGIDATTPFDRADLQNLIKWHCKYARQNGIHVFPTFMIDGPSSLTSAAATMSASGRNAFRPDGLFRMHRTRPARWGTEARRRHLCDARGAMVLFFLP
ncbi:Thioredoxin|nr:Thioredoxin [Candidatus Pantoea persica]